MMNVFKILYEIPGNCISVERAVELDVREDVQKTFSPDAYRQPVLTDTMLEPLMRPDHSESLSMVATDDDAGKVV